MDSADYHTTVRGESTVSINSKLSSRRGDISTVLGCVLTLILNLETLEDLDLTILQIGRAHV